MQRLELLSGTYAVERLAPDAALPDAWLSVVRAPEGVTVARAAADGTWVALYSGASAHAPDVPGMLVALLAPLAEAGVPVMVASTFDADVLFVPAVRRDEAVAALRGAGHEVG